MRANRRDVSRVPLQDCEGNFLHKITHAEGCQLCANGTALAVRDFRYGRNQICGYRITEAPKASNSQSSSAMLGAADARLCVMRSRTARLPEWGTKGRDSKFAREMARDPRLPVEDGVEKAQNRIKMWRGVPLLNPRRQAWASA